MASSCCVLSFQNVTWKNECVCFLLLLTSQHTLSCLEQHVCYHTVSVGLARLAAGRGWPGLRTLGSLAWAESIPRRIRAVCRLTSLCHWDWGLWRPSGCCWKLPSAPEGKCRSLALFTGSSVIALTSSRPESLSCALVRRSYSITSRACHQVKQAREEDKYCIYGSLLCGSKKKRVRLRQRRKVAVRGRAGWTKYAAFAERVQTFSCTTSEAWGLMRGVVTAAGHAVLCDGHFLREWSLHVLTEFIKKGLWGAASDN